MKGKENLRNDHRLEQRAILDWILHTKKDISGKLVKSKWSLEFS